MPKVEIKEKTFWNLMGQKLPYEKLESMLEAAKAEIDGIDEANSSIKVEFNDTNRPDLWSVTGVVRFLKSYYFDTHYNYDFFSTKEKILPSSKEIHVDGGYINEIRPYVSGLCISGKTVDEDLLHDIIQTQEKICWNFGQKRKAFSMGVYRSDLFEFPIKYKTVSPQTRFLPLECQEMMSLDEVIEKTQKGKEYGHIVKGHKEYPILMDKNNKILSFPPILNSNDLGAVKVGDSNLFIELCGTDLEILLLATSIVACDMKDLGFKVEPVKVVYSKENHIGKEITTPYYFQKKASADKNYINKILGSNFSHNEISNCLKKMDLNPAWNEDKLLIEPPFYRNDFLHQSDIIEDVMIGFGLNNFEKTVDIPFTIGSLQPAEEFSRKISDIMVGLGFQEMIYNYIGSKKDFIDKVLQDQKNNVEILNPMTENYQFLRNSIIPLLLLSESVSAHAIYPHNIFEIGKVVLVDEKENYGSATKNYLGFMSSDKERTLNDITNLVYSLFYLLNVKYEVKALDDVRFIKGRAASIVVGGTKVGYYGELSPEVLENYGVFVPSIACEIDIDELMKTKNQH